MTETRNLARFASIANAAFNSMSANSTAILSMSVGGASINATSFAGTANNASNLGGVAAASYALLASPSFTGNVGIGTATPSWDLHINDAAAPVIQLQEGTEGNTFIGQDANSFFIRRGTIGTTDALSITSGSNIGIGVTSPGNRLAVASSANTNDGIYYTNQNTGTGAQAVLGLNTQGALGLQLGQNYSSKNAFIYLADAAALTLSTNAAVRMTIDAAGNIGVGTAAPGVRLDVNGSVRGQGDIAVENSTAEGGRLRIMNTSKTGNTTSDWSLWNMTGVYGNGLSFWRYYGNGTNAGTAMFLADSGNVGIGTVAPNATLAVVGTANVSGNVTVGGSINAANVTATVFTGNLTGTASSVTNGVYTSGDQSIAGIKTFTTDVRAPIFYDSNDTNWYCNPNGLSRLVSLQLAVNNWNSTTEGWNRLYFVSGDSSIYQGGSTGQWAHQFRNSDGTTRWLMEAAGNFWASGNITAYWSDRRLKKNIQKITDWRNIINGLNGYRYEWNDIGCKVLENTESGIQVGLIAQEVQEALPQAAAVQMMQYKGKNPDGSYEPKDDINYDPENPYLTVREEKLIPVLVEAIKGVIQELDSLKVKYEKLEANVKGSV